MPARMRSVRAVTKTARRCDGDERFDGESRLLRVVLIVASGTA